MKKVPPLFFFIPPTHIVFALVLRPLPFLHVCMFPKVYFTYLVPLPNTISS